MPLVTCPDCAREISAKAPACIRCGRPMGTSSSPANPEERPTMGIDSDFFDCGVVDGRRVEDQAR